MRSLKSDVYIINIENVLHKDSCFTQNFWNASENVRKDWFIEVLENDDEKIKLFSSLVLGLEGQTTKYTC